MTGVSDRDLTIVALRGALPYLRLYKGRVFVVKIGGALCGSPEGLRRLAEQIGILCEFGIRTVLVHGGGPQATALQKTLGIEPRFIEGRRVTCERTLDVAVMTINGSVNSAVLAACRATGLLAVGLSGIDAGLIDARKRPVRTRVTAEGKETIDYGEVGDIVGIDTTVVTSLLDQGIVPVISPLAADPEGRILNINADTVASSIAREMRAEKLIFLSEAPGLLEDKNDPSTLISYIDVRGLNVLLEKGALDTGMLPKATAAKEALYGGVRRVHMIGNSGDSLLREVFTNEGSGTLLVMEIADLLPAEQHPTSRLNALLGRSETASR